MVSNTINNRVYEFSNPLPNGKPWILNDKTKNVVTFYYTNNVCITGIIKYIDDVNIVLTTNEKYNKNNIIGSVYNFYNQGEVDLSQFIINSA